MMWSNFHFGETWVQCDGQFIGWQYWKRRDQLWDGFSCPFIYWEISTAYFLCARHQCTARMTRSSNSVGFAFSMREMWVSWNRSTRHGFEKRFQKYLKVGNKSKWHSVRMKEREEFGIIQETFMSNKQQYGSKTPKSDLTLKS